MGDVQKMAIFSGVFTPHSELWCDVSGWMLNSCKGIYGVDYAGI